MLSGTSPFKDASEWLIFQRIIARDVKFPDYFSDASRDLIDQLLVSYTCLSGKLKINSTPAIPFDFSSERIFCFTYIIFQSELKYNIYVDSFALTYPYVDQRLVSSGQWLVLPPSEFIFLVYI